MHWKCISVTAVPDVRVEGMRERRYGGDEERDGKDEDKEEARGKVVLKNRVFRIG